MIYMTKDVKCDINFKLGIIFEFAIEFQKCNLIC